MKYPDHSSSDPRQQHAHGVFAATCDRHAIIVTAPFHDIRDRKERGALCQLEAGGHQPGNSCRTLALMNGTRLPGSEDIFDASLQCPACQWDDCVSRSADNREWHCWNCGHTEILVC